MAKEYVKPQMTIHEDYNLIITNSIGDSGQLSKQDNFEQEDTSIVNDLWDI